MSRGYNTTAYWATDRASMELEMLQTFTSIHRYLPMQRKGKIGLEWRCTNRATQVRGSWAAAVLGQAGSQTSWLSCRPVRWRPEHKNKLGNEFCFYTADQATAERFDGWDRWWQIWCICRSLYSSHLHMSLDDLYSLFCLDEWDQDLYLYMNSIQASWFIAVYDCSLTYLTNDWDQG